MVNGNPVIVRFEFGYGAVQFQLCTIGLLSLLYTACKNNTSVGSPSLSLPPLLIPSCK